MKNVIALILLGICACDPVDMARKSANPETLSACAWLEKNGTYHHSLTEVSYNASLCMIEVNHKLDLLLEASNECKR